MFNLSRDIQSLSTFKRNSGKIIKEMKTTGNPLVLTVNGKAEIVVQDAAAYQKLLDKIQTLETITANNQRSSDEPSALLDLYGSAANIEFAIDGQGISDEMDSDLSGVFNE